MVHKSRPFRPTENKRETKVDSHIYGQLSCFAYEILVPLPAIELVPLEMEVWGKKRNESVEF